MDPRMMRQDMGGRRPPGMERAAPPAPPINPIGIKIQKTAAILKISLAMGNLFNYYNLTFISIF